MSRRLAFFGLLAIGFLAGATEARADFQYRIQTSGGSSTDTGVLVFGGNPGSFNGTYGGIAVNSSGASWQSNAFLGQLLSASLEVHNNNTATTTITISISVNGLSAPPSPLSYASHFSGTWGTFSNSNASTHASSYFNGGGTLFALTNALDHATFGPSSSFSNDLRGSDQTYSPTYSLTQIITITLNGGAVPGLGGDLQFTLRTELLPTPEPATIVSAIIGIPALGGFWLRRRRANAVA